MFKGKKIDKSRYTSILLILIAVLPAIFATAYGGKYGVYVGSGFFALSCGFAIWETLTAIGFNKYISVLTAAMVIPFFLVSFSNFKSIATYADLSTNESAFNKLAVELAITWKPIVILLFASLIPVVTEPHVAKAKFGITGTQLVVTFIVLIGGVFFKSLWAMNASGLNPVFFFLLIAISADSFGYLGGKYFGKKLFKGAKFAPKISPKKTWAGAVIGFGFSFTFALLFGYYLGIWEEMAINQWLISSIMALVLSIVSPIGDLTFSLIKRRVGIKDFSELLPGHGGVFDRIDAMSFVTVVGTLAFLISN